MGGGAFCQITIVALLAGHRTAEKDEVIGVLLTWSDWDRPSTAEPGGLGLILHELAPSGAQTLSFYHYTRLCCRTWLYL